MSIFFYLFVGVCIYLFIYLSTYSSIHFFLFWYGYTHPLRFVWTQSLWRGNPVINDPCWSGVSHDKWQIHLVGIQDGFGLFGILPNNMSKHSRKWKLGKTSSIFSVHFLAPSCHPSKLTLRVLSSRGARPRGMISVSVGRSWWEYSWCRTWPRLGLYVLSFCIISKKICRTSAGLLLFKIVVNFFLWEDHLFLSGHVTRIHSNRMMT